jgi:uncharacterized protein YcbK (DUF882 family)
MGEMARWRSIPVFLFAAWLCLSGGALAVRRHASGKPLRADRSRHGAVVVELFHLTTHERLLLAFDHRGRLSPGTYGRLRRLLRCHHSGKRGPLDRQLVAFLYEVAAHYPGHRVQIVAGYRARRVARQKGNPKSLHSHGAAVDFRIEGVAVEEVRDWMREHFKGRHVGVGYYPNPRSQFVHLDVRHRGPDAYWIDHSGPGQLAIYERDPEVLQAKGALPAPQGAAAPPAPSDAQLESARRAPATLPPATRLAN